MDDGMSEYLSRNHGVTIEQLTEALVITRQFMRDDGYIRPIHPQTYVITNDDETGFVASEIERFDLWCAENEIEPHYMSIVLWANRGKRQLLIGKSHICNIGQSRRVLLWPGQAILEV